MQLDSAIHFPGSLKFPNILQVVHILRLPSHVLLDPESTLGPLHVRSLAANFGLFLCPRIALAPVPDNANIAISPLRNPDLHA